MKNVTSILFAAALTAAALGSCKPKPTVVPAFDKIEHRGEFKTAAGTFDVDYHFEYLSALADPAALQKVQQAMAADFFGPDFAKADARTSAAAFDASLPGAYAMQADSTAIEGYAHIHSTAALVGENIVAYTVDRDEYTGGAHGMATTTLANYNLATGARLTLDDVFTPEGRTELAGAIRGEIVRMKNVAAWDELVDTECFNPVGEVGPTENFLLGADNITFVYNPYDIACYAAGSTRVTLSTANLAGFRKELIAPKL